jgi:hypothetical protein
MAGQEEPAAEGRRNNQGAITFGARVGRGSGIGVNHCRSFMGGA